MNDSLRLTGDAGPVGPLTAPPPPARPFPGFLHSVGLVIAVFAAANFVSLPAMLILALIKFGPTAFGAMIGTASGWMQIIGSIDLALLSIPSNSIGFGVIIWLGWRATHRRAREVFPFRSLSPLAWVAVGVTFAGGFLTVGLVSDLLVRILPVPQSVIDFFSNFLGKDKGVTSFILLAVVAPVTEEFLFRGLIVFGLEQRYRPVAACLLSAVLFGAMHILPWQVVPAFLLGVLFAWWRIETGSLWPSLVAHVITNSIAFYQGLNHSVKEALTAPPQPAWQSALGLVLLVVGVYWAAPIFRREAQRRRAGSEWLVENA